MPLLRQKECGVGIPINRGVALATRGLGRCEFLLLLRNTDDFANESARWPSVFRKIIGATRLSMAKRRICGDELHAEFVTFSMPVGWAF